MNIAKKIEFTRLAHFGQLDKSGYEYWYHPLRVMLRLGPSATTVERDAGLLHDVLEDTKVTKQEMLDAGFSEEAVDTVDKFLTRREGTTYSEYIQNIIVNGNDTARKCKFADLADNLSPGRSAKLPEHLRGINTRHVKARDLLWEAFGDAMLGRIVWGDLPDEFMKPFLSDKTLVIALDAKIVKWDLLYLKV